jgi:hypothetical protein
MIKRRLLDAVNVFFFNMHNDISAIDRIVRELEKKIVLNNGSNNGTTVDDALPIACGIAEMESSTIVASVGQMGTITFTKVVME